MIWWVYILQCADGMFYVGMTTNLKRRVGEHNAGIKTCLQKSRRPVKLVWKKEYRYYKKAFLMEKRLKRLTRLQKESLVKGRRLDKVLKEAGK